MLSIQITDGWRTAFPGVTIGLLEMSGVDATKPCPGLEQRRREAEARRLRFHPHGHLSTNETADDSVVEASQKT